MSVKLSTATVRSPRLPKVVPPRNGYALPGADLAHSARAVAAGAIRARFRRSATDTERDALAAMIVERVLSSRARREDTYRTAQPHLHGRPRDVLRYIGAMLDRPPLVLAQEVERGEYGRTFLESVARTCMDSRDWRDTLDGYAVRERADRADRTRRYPAPRVESGGILGDVVMEAARTDDPTPLAGIRPDLAHGIAEWLVPDAPRMQRLVAAALLYRLAVEPGEGEARLVALAAVQGRTVTAVQKDANRGAAWLAVHVDPDALVAAVRDALTDPRDEWVQVMRPEHRPYRKPSPEDRPDRMPDPVHAASRKAGSARDVLRYLDAVVRAGKVVR